MYDVIVVGARCAGSALSMLLARQGANVLLLDRGAFPSDIMSTHYIQPQGVGLLVQWGLVDRVAASGCPPLYRLIRGTPAGTEVDEFRTPDGKQLMALAPRRTVLDQILVDAAVEAGAELREHVSVRDLVRDQDGVVTGVLGHDANGAPVTETARVVVGADGLHSQVARLVEPESYNEAETLICAYYSYFSDVAGDGAEIYFKPGSAALIFPTNDNLACVAAVCPAAAFPDYRKDIDGYFHQTLRDADESVYERVSAGHREERWTGTVDLPQYFRKPYGPGWALVGDAGLHIDPTLGLGITKAFTEAAMLAPALDAYLAGAAPFDAAMDGFQQQRDAVWIPWADRNIEAARSIAAGQLPAVPHWTPA